MLDDGHYIEYLMPARPRPEHPEGRELVDLPDELYLRELFDLNEEDPEALADWSGRWGRLTDLGKGAYLRIMEPGPTGSVDTDTLYQLTRRAQRFAKRIDHPIPDLVVNARVVRAHVDQLRGLAQHWITYVADPGNDEALAELWAESDPAIAWFAFGSGLNRALRPFQVRTGIEGFEGWEAGVLEVNCYSAMALQLYNHMAEGATWRTCANEPCRRPFVRQRGRAKHGQYRSRGVTYCSASCAQAQKSRDYRRRKREARS